MRRTPSARCYVSVSARCVRALPLLAAVAVAGCGITTWAPTLHAPVDGVPGPRPGAYLKVHMETGELYVLTQWSVPEGGGELAGYGDAYDAERVYRGSRTFSVPLDQVALLETNQRETVSRFSQSGLSLLSIVSGVVTAACVADPKACFGSCPTFYTVDDPDRPVAEGFSASFAKALEADDTDDLGLTARTGPFSLVMRNEALETHAVRRASLWAVPVDASGPTYQVAGGGFVRGEGIVPPVSCRSVEGDCLAGVVRRDDLEYAPKTDPEDLAVREEVVLSFGAVAGELGLAVTARNSFVTTYAFYQSLAYAGEQTGDLMAALERGEEGATDRVLGLARELGDVGAFVSLDGGAWERVGSFGEPGPIAADRQVIRLGSVQASDVRVMLRMARGSWRIDEAALVRVGREVEPVEVPLDSVTSAHAPDPAAAAERLADPDRHLVTVPGDEYRLWYTLPAGGEQQLFLDTRGYYYEWVRDEWLPEESAVAVAEVLLEPREALRRMAPGFKEIETEMERLFWTSRFRR